MEPDLIPDQTIEDVAQFHEAITGTLGSLVIGNADLIEIIVTALLAEGHVLIEGIPGTAKTTIAKAVAHATGCRFDRVQGTVDLLPPDLVGVRIFDPVARAFSLRKGPVFTNILLADELNRINPKSQSAFIEAMSEGQATIDGETCRIDRPFLVLATQDPYEMQGTFPLIDAQRDRFMFGFRSGHLDADEELDLVKRASAGKLDWDRFAGTAAPATTREDLLGMIRAVRTVRMGDPVLTYIRDLVVATRKNGNVDLGASSRASIAFVRGARAKAAIARRDYVLPDDVKALAPLILCHRIILTREAETENLRAADVVSEILETVEVP